MRRPHGSHAALAALVTGAAVLLATGHAGAGAPRETYLPVTLEIEANEGPGGACQAGAYFQFSEIKGASKYTINFTDNGQPKTYTLPPFDAAADAGAPPGVHRAGLTGYNSSGGGCGNPDAEWRARFKLGRTTALVDPMDGKIVGRVTKVGGNKPFVGAWVEATGPSPNGHRPGRVFGAVAGRDGRYSIKIPKKELAEYTMSAHWPPFAFESTPDRVRVTNGATVTANLTAKYRKPPGDPRAVARVTEIKPVDPSKPTKAEFFSHEEQWLILQLDTELKPGDLVRTDDNTAVAVELDLGGRVAVKPSSEFKLLGERSVRDKNQSFSLTKGGVWAKCGQMKESLEIQTTGGVMGIKG